MSETDLIPEPWGAFLRELDEIATELQRQDLLNKGGGFRALPEIPCIS